MHSITIRYIHAVICIYVMMCLHCVVVSTAASPQVIPSAKMAANATTVFVSVH